MKNTKPSRIGLVVIVLLVSIGGAVIAQDTAPPYETFPQALGGFYGPFSGTGLHYQRWFGQTGFHVAGGVIYVPYSDTDLWYPDTTLDYAIGGEFQHRVYGEAFTNWLAGSLYLFAGAQHRGFIPVELVADGYYTDPNDESTWVDPVFAVGSFQAQISIGAGIGIELIVFRHFSVPLEFGYGATWTPTEPVLANAFAVGPNVQTGLRYRY